MDVKRELVHATNERESLRLTANAAREAQAARDERLRERARRAYAASTSPKSKRRGTPAPAPAASGRHARDGPATPAAAAGVTHRSLAELSSLTADLPGSPRHVLASPPPSWLDRYSQPPLLLRSPGDPRPPSRGAPARRDVARGTTTPYRLASAAKVVQRAARGRMARARYAEAREAAAHDAWLDYYLSNGALGGGCDGTPTSPRDEPSR